MNANHNQDINIINEKFKFMGFLDHARWCGCSNEKKLCQTIIPSIWQIRMLQGKNSC